MLFALQAAIGAGVIGYTLGLLKGKQAGRSSIAASDPAD